MDDFVWWVVFLLLMPFVVTINGFLLSWVIAFGSMCGRFRAIVHMSKSKERPDVSKERPDV